MNPSILIDQYGPCSTRLLTTIVNLTFFQGFYVIDRFQVHQSFFPQLWSNYKIRLTTKLLGKINFKKRMIVLVDIDVLMEVK